MIEYLDLSPLAYVLIFLAGVLGFEIGRHSAVYVDLGHPMTHWRARREQRRKEREAVKDWPIILPRRRFLTLGIAVTTLLLVATGFATHASLQASDTRREAAAAARDAAAASRQAAQATKTLTDFVGCYVDYQTRFVDGYGQRIDASDPVGQALEDIFRLIIEEDGQALQVQSRAVIVDYLSLRELQRKAQRENPSPPTPAQVCGRVEKKGKS